MFANEVYNFANANYSAFNVWWSRYPFRFARSWTHTNVGHLLPVSPSPSLPVVPGNFTRVKVAPASVWPSRFELSLTGVARRVFRNGKEIFQADETYL